MFAEYNSRAAKQAADSQGLVDRLSEKLEELEDDVSYKLSNFLEKYSMKDKSLGPVPEGKLGKIKWQANALRKIASDGKYRQIMMTYLDRIGIMDVSGSIASIIRDFVESDELEKTIDFMQLGADKIDQEKMNIITTVKAGIRDGFKTRLSDKQEEMVSRVVLDTDMQSVYRMYTTKQWIEMLRDPKKLEAKLGNAKTRLEMLDKKNYYWHVNQASGLGYYMATGKAHIAQNLNTENIAKGYLSGSRKKPWIKTRGDLEAHLNEVAVLTALKYTKSGKKDLAK